MTSGVTAMNLEPLEMTFGARVTEVRLSEIDDATFADLYRAWLDYGLLVFPAQHLSRDQQVAFARRFGDLIEGLESALLSNVKQDGSLRDAPDDDMMKIIRGNMHWHQDNTYMPVQAKGAVFSAQVVPREQGDTAFADMRAAYAALDEDRQRQIAGLSAHHSLARSQIALGEAVEESADSEYVGYGLDVESAPLRPLVKIHPETGIPALAVGRHAYAIPGWDDEASDAFLTALIDFAVSDASRVYTHRWQAGDVVVWDNRCLMHRACPWDYTKARVMLHSRIAGDVETEGCTANA
ncbi:MAG: TauD/TfdA family dioxygenase [Myxococcota bacterium]